MTTPLMRRVGILGLLSLLAASLFFISSPASAQSVANPANAGPYGVSTATASSLGSPFGGGDIYYPSTAGTYGGIAVSPGFTAGASSMAWYGRRLATHGFVAIVIETDSRLDQPNDRASQLLAALDWLKSSSSPSAVRSRLDANRLAVSGHSMGGGGSIAASNSRSSLRASVPLTPWHTQKSWPNNTVPQLVVGAQNDSVAPTATHAVALYNGIRSATPKMYVELRGASHFAPNTTDADISRMAVSWFKRWVDGNTAYNTYLCGAQRPTTGLTWSRVMDNCSLGWGSGGGNGGTTTTTAPAQVCIRSSNRAHVDANRAVSVLGVAYARGSGDLLGLNSSLSFSSLRQTGPNYWVEVSSC
jgi:dienelactone hydrolase